MEQEYVFLIVVCLLVMGGIVYMLYWDYSNTNNFDGSYKRTCRELNMDPLNVQEFNGQKILTCFKHGTGEVVRLRMNG